jgi:hypothetical protein
MQMILSVVLKQLTEAIASFTSIQPLVSPVGQTTPGGNLSGSVFLAWETENKAVDMATAKDNLIKFLFIFI